ncbi:MAG: MBOAT family protein [bacterium]|nr:MBOAT family protein [bacterium]
MVFSSLMFIFRFLPVFLILYFITPERYRNLTLFGGSLIFYAIGEPMHLILLLLSVYINHHLGLCIARCPRRPRKRQFYFVLAMLYNFGMLFVFKYTDFLIENINLLTGFISRHAGIAIPAIPLLHLALPLGISFYTFQIASYIIDIYRGTQKPERSIVTLGTYLCMFPQLIAGPIVMYPDVSASLKKRHISLEDFEDGLKTFTLGLGSKVLLANRIFLLWNDIQVTGFDGISTPLAWLGAFAYSFQIFFDFYGYSLMAIGLGRMLGFCIPENFRFPYMAASVSEFWRRWHITLGTWFRTYIYIPLGGNRNGLPRTIRNLFFVWALTGLWHGASWNFILWGLLFFVLIALEKLFLGKVFTKCRFLGHLYIIVLIPVTWIIFSITDLPSLGVYLTRLFPFVNGSSVWVFGTQDYVYALKDFGPLFALCVLFSTPLPAKLYRKHKKNPLTILTLLGIFWLSIYYLLVSVNNPFLYFRF